MSIPPSLSMNIRRNQFFPSFTYSISTNSKSFSSKMGWISSSVILTTELKRHPPFPLYLIMSNSNHFHLKTSLVQYKTPAKACGKGAMFSDRSEEHTSELQSRFDFVYHLLLEKKKNYTLLY